MFFKNVINNRQPRILSRRDNFTHFEYLPVGEVDEIKQFEDNLPLDHPVLFIGIGDTGAALLKEIKQHLKNIHFGEIPQDLAFLWLGFEREDSDLSFLASDETVLLEVGSIEHPRNRIGVRKKFIEFVQTNGNSSLTNAIKRVHKSTNTIPPRKAEIVLLHSLGEVESAMLIPLCHWLREVPLLKGAISRVTTFSGLTTFSDHSETNLSKDAIFLSLREIFRFCSGVQQRLDLGIPGLSNITQGSLISKVMLFDAEEIDLVYNSIFAYLSTRQNSFESNRQDLKVYSDIISLVKYEVPLAQVKEYLATSLRSTFLKGTAPDLSQYRVRLQAVDFLRKPLWNQENFPFSIVADAYEGAPQDLYYDLPPANTLDGFKWGLVYYLNENIFPNDDFGFEVLKWQREFLGELKAIIHTSKTSLSFIPEKFKGFECIFEMQSLIPAMEKVIEGMETQVDRWEKQNIHETETKDLNFLQFDDRAINWIVRSSANTFIKEIQNNYPLALLEKRSKWYWKISDSEEPELDWIFLEKEYRGGFTLKKGVNSQLMSRNIGLVDQFIDTIIDNFLHSINIFTEMDRLDNRFADVNTKQLHASLASKQPKKTLSSAQSLISRDLNQLRDFAQKNKLESISCNPSFINDAYSVTFFRIDEDVPLDSMTAGITLKNFNHANSNIILFEEEKNAIDLEQKLEMKKGDYFSPAFVGLMKDIPAFKVMMECIFWNLIRQAPGVEEKGFCIMLGKGRKDRMVIDYCGVESANLKEALYFSLVNNPSNGLDVTQPFYIDNFSRTIHELEVECKKLKEDKAAKKAQAEIARKNCLEWSKSSDVFYQDLSKYIQSVFL